uniref:Hypothetical secreted protein 1223 n=1 Tax=Amblyomma variegatum TaxID=34610 RepID=F0J9U1_AMBVA|nr:TPA_inf: hypothetical secreted protein 1223 [Amblyomma variegatum]
MPMLAALLTAALTFGTSLLNAQPAETEKPILLPGNCDYNGSIYKEGETDLGSPCVKVVCRNKTAYEVACTPPGDSSWCANVTERTAETTAPTFPRCCEKSPCQNYGTDPGQPKSRGRRA